MIAVSSFIIALSGALVPGPLFTITVGESFRRGFIAGPLIILGHAILELSLVVLLILGVMPFLAAESTRHVVGIAGGTILVIMGGTLIRDAAKKRLEMSLKDGRRGLHPVLAGIVGSISNPYWLIWWATVGLGYLVSSLKYGLLGVGAFFLGHITADLAWYSLISLTVTKGRGLVGDRGYRFMLYACGVFLIFFGGWFISGAAM